MKIIIVDQAGLSLLESIENPDMGAFFNGGGVLLIQTECLHLKSLLLTKLQEKVSIFAAMK